MSRLVPIIGGAVAGGAIALVVASGGASTHTVTTDRHAARELGVAGADLAEHVAGADDQPDLPRRRARASSTSPSSSSQTSGGGFFGGSGGQQQQTGEGAGVVYDTKGNILTDEHVVAGATSVKVHFQNGHTRRPPRCSAPTRRPTSP